MTAKISAARQHWKIARRRFARSVVAGIDARADAHKLAIACDRLVRLLERSSEDWRACRRWRRYAVNIMSGAALRAVWIDRIRAVAGAEEKT